MSRNSYDDWTINSEDKNSFSLNNKILAFVFGFCCLVLIASGIINLYSITFPKTIYSGLNSFHYALVYAAFCGAGLVLGAVFLILPRVIIRLVSILFTLVSICFLWANYFLGMIIVPGEAVYCFIFTFTVLYLCTYFAKRNNCIDKNSVLAVPIIVCVAVFWGILYNNGFSYALLFALISCVVFLCCGTGLPGVLLLLLFLVVPAVFWAFSKQENIDTVFRFFLKSDISSNYQIKLRLSCINNATFTGSGLGLGSCKLSGMDGLEQNYALLNILDELGIIGLCAFFLIIATMIFCCGYASYKSYNKNMLAYNIIVCLGFLLFSQMVLNIVQTFALSPFTLVSMPFFSNSVCVVVNIAQIALICKFILSNKIKG